MTFDKVLPSLMQGKRARRALWSRSDIVRGDWAQRIILPPMDEQGFQPQIMSWHESDQRFYLWGGINLDIQGDDWEIL